MPVALFSIRVKGHVMSGGPTYSIWTSIDVEAPRPTIPEVRVCQYSRMHDTLTGIVRERGIFCKAQQNWTTVERTLVFTERSLEGIPHVHVVDEHVFDKAIERWHDNQVDCRHASKREYEVEDIPVRDIQCETITSKFLLRPTNISTNRFRRTALS